MKASKLIIAIAATAVPAIVAGIIYYATQDKEETAGLRPVEPFDLAGAKQVIDQKCAGCHQMLDGGGWYRISNMRKTPEGWQQTLLRMRLWHDVELTDIEQRKIVKYLADRQGLAPAETAGWRWALEQVPNHPPKAPNPTLGEFCGRCHSFARVALQHRDEDEWRRLAHTHLGQWPSLEHQEKARNYENYWEIFHEDVSRDLATLYPFETEAWKDWRAAEKADLSGRWSVSGEDRGKGRYIGALDVEKIADDQYTTRYHLVYQDGSVVEGKGRSLVYNGYEWRGSASLGGRDVQAVYAYDRLAEDFEILTGRWYEADADELGASFGATRMEDGPQIISVEKPFLRAGETAEVSIFGHNLGAADFDAGSVGFGEGVTVNKIVSRGNEQVVVEITVAEDAPLGTRRVRLGAVGASAAFRVIDQIDYLTVEPGVAIARVGGGGGPVPKVKAQFVARAWLTGTDGKPGTKDDINLGSVDADWTIENDGAAAEAGHDAEFAGEIDQTGLFTPAEAGINEARAEYGRATNNTGELLVVATVDSGGKTLVGSADLVVTLQRWVNPVIR